VLFLCSLFRLPLHIGRVYSVLAVWIHFGRYVFRRQCGHDDAEDYGYWYCHHILKGSFFVLARSAGRHFGHPILGVKACQSLCISALIRFLRACNSLCHTANPPQLAERLHYFPLKRLSRGRWSGFAKKSEKKSGDEQTESGSCLDRTGVSGKSQLQTLGYRAEKKRSPS
jgi:hypothetical protein